jgi:hypothetical protein
MTRRIAHAAQIGALVLALALVPAALAAKGSGGKPSSGAGGSNSLSLVVIDSSDGLPHWSNHVTFKVSTTTSWPSVTLTCYQNGAPVLTQTAGFWPDYTWGQIYALNNGTWTGGAADCTASLSAQSSHGKSSTLASISFHVYA